eukprot:13525-Heterococcus_DN1.PRE.3
MAPSYLSQCKYFGTPRGCWKGEACLLRHGSNDQRSCRFFASGSCKFGANCLFSHAFAVPPPPKVVNMPDIPRPEATEEATKEMVQYLQFRKRTRDDFLFVLNVLEVCKAGEPLMQQALFARFTLCDRFLQGDCTHELKEDICAALLHIVENSGQHYSARVVNCATLTFSNLVHKSHADWLPRVLETASKTAKTCAAEKSRRTLLDLCTEHGLPA